MKDKRWLYIAILAVTVATIWAGVSALARLRKSTIPSDIERVATPLDPTIDKAVFDDLKNRERAGGGQ